MKLKSLTATMSVGIMFATLCACKKTNNDTVPVEVKLNVQLTTNAKFGTVLSDSVGRTLYSFANDNDGQSSACVSSGCMLTWPPFYTNKPSLGTGLAATDFGVISRPDGSKQTTYKGWPLYYYKSDVNSGDANGDGIGGNWFVSKSDYTVMLANKQLPDANNNMVSTQFITDAYGRTLYAFAPDKNMKNTFTKSDLSNNATWPVFEVATVQKAPSVLDVTAFMAMTVFGKTQLTYKGWPMYYFGADAQTRGNTKGISAYWPLLNKNSVVAPL